MVAGALPSMTLLLTWPRALLLCLSSSRNPRVASPRTTPARGAASASDSTWRNRPPETWEHPSPPATMLSGPSGHPVLSSDRAKETRTQAQVSETCILFLLIVNLFTTNIVKEFSNKTHKNPEDFVFLLCRILRKHHHTARKEILKTNQQPHTWTRPAQDPGAAPGVWVIVRFGGAPPCLPPSPPSLWDLNGEDKENPDSP